MGYYYGIGGEYYILLFVFATISIIVSQLLKSKFKAYSKIQLRNGLSGAEIAEKMLADHGIRDVKVVSVKGMLTDHYNPIKKTVNLSESVYSERNAAAAAVAAHECGHAVQHAQGYEWLKMRSVLVPVVSVASNLSMWVIIIGLSFFGGTQSYTIASIGAWLRRKNMVGQQEFAAAKDSLKWAALTYVVAAIGSLATLIYLVLRVNSQRR